MNPLNCIIVDDEPLSRDVLRKYISDITSLDLKAECKDALEANRVLSEQTIDLMFLDINMPLISGISFARSLTSAPMIIFTTAYPEFAVEGFELNAVDYLVKPFSFERFLKAVNRALERKPENGMKEQRKILLKADKKLYAVPVNDIAYVEGCGDYIRVVSSEHSLLVHDTIKSILENLPESLFMRVQKSYVINLKMVEYIEGNRAVMNNKKIPVAAQFKDELLEKLSRM